jgi:hypothetical protein
MRDIVETVRQVIRRDRKVFDYLHTELSVLAGKFIPRWDMWEEFDGPPTKERALRFLRERAAQVLPDIPEKKLRRLTKRFERWDPDADTPEEIFSRICGIKD